MNIKITEDGDSPKRDALIKKTLPKETIISTILEPSIEERLFDIIAECIKKELEIYRNYPKNSKDHKSKEKSTETFDPRNNETCFMGKAFRGNSELTDHELAIYRKAIGTIHHPVWGDCTLLEIWGGDHFEDYNKMVVGAFEYGMNLTNTCPDIKVFTNPLFQNKKSKTFRLSEAQQNYKDEMDMLLAKAVVFGVKDPKQAMRDRKKRSFNR